MLFLYSCFLLAASVLSLMPETKMLAQDICMVVANTFYDASHWTLAWQYYATAADAAAIVNKT